jgi:hypothetical protein
VYDILHQKRGGHKNSYGISQTCSEMNHKNAATRPFNLSDYLDKNHDHVNLQIR